MAFPNAEEIRLGANRIFSVDWEAFRLFRLRRLLLDNNHLLVRLFPFLALFPLLVHQRAHAPLQSGH